MMVRWLVIVAAFTCLVTRADAKPRLEPDHGTARRNGFHVFNAVHSAARQWGSALKHNGMSFFPVVMPRGTLLYHGDQSPTRPTVPEWMSFEVEHAEAFAFTMDAKPEDPHVGGDYRTGNQKPIGPLKDSTHGEDRRFRGYFHTYRANRDLQILYVDGMSAGKSRMGTLDTQDLVLRENKTNEWGSFMDEIARSVSICEILTEWGFDALMRMEIGFELIHCDFNAGVDLISVTRSPVLDNSTFERNMHPYQWARAVAERYDGIGGDRVKLDFSSMVSAYFFPVNMSNTDPERPDLPRLSAASPAEWKAIKAHVKEAATSKRRFTVNWQAVTDMVVSRYAARIALMTSPNVTASLFEQELSIATNAYFNNPPMPGDITLADESEGNETLKALGLCKQHYLLPTYLDQDMWSQEDKLTHTSISTVTDEICDVLFEARSIMDECHSKNDTQKADTNDETSCLITLNSSRRLIQELKAKLSWPIWKKPTVCAVDELLFTVMWPLGNRKDYENPGCRTMDDVNFGRHDYWRP